MRRCAMRRCVQRLYIKNDNMERKINHEKLAKHLKSKWMGKPCQMCGVGSWHMTDTVFELRVYREGNLLLDGGPITPYIPIICDNCGYTVFVNADVAGLIDPE